MDIEARKVFETRTLAQMTTGIENRDPHALAMLDLLEPGHARIVGITGPPGAGKSTLVDALAMELRRQGKTVAILAIDPTSRRTGGAILGDRIRMQQHHADPGIFIRSMATRGESGGIARATADVARLMSASGKDYVIIETVGVGQDEVEIAGLAQVTVVVLVPGMGDDVQTIKAGIMEIADIFVINKSDLPGADVVEHEVQAMLSLADGQKPPIIRTVARDGTGVPELLASIEDRSLWSRLGNAPTLSKVPALPHTPALPDAPPLPNRDRKGAGVTGAVVTLRVTDPTAAVETLRAAGLLLELIEESAK